MRLIIGYNYYNVIVWNKNGFSRTYDMLFLSLEFLNEDFDYILFLKFDTPMSIVDISASSLISYLNFIFETDQDLFLVLTNRKNAPTFKESSDEFVYSFACDFRKFKKIIAGYKDKFLTSKIPLFLILDQILLGKTNFNKLKIEQLPISSFHDSAVGSSNNHDVIIPHKCDDNYLIGLMSFLKEVKSINIYIGIDQPLNHHIYQLRERYPNSSFYIFDPNPVGPYIIRNRLVDMGKNEIVFFQDSDDVSCINRFSMISNHMINENCQLCGSHELKLDYFDNTVRAVRYPLDVTYALNAGAGHSLLHPASAIYRNSIYLLGRLSEDRKFANDTKFLYNSFFKLNKIQNVDEFLYIRRIRPNSLTSYGETKIGSPERYKLMIQWVRQFDRVKNGILRLENSDLIFRPSNINYLVTKI